MADISTFPTLDDVLIHGDFIKTFTVATAAVKAGMVVGFNATGVSETVEPMLAGAGEHPIGVALYDAAIGSKVAVCMPGCIVLMVNYDGSTGIDAGDWLETNDATVGGTVGAVNQAATGGATVTVHFLVIGKALEDIAGGSYGKALIWPCCLVQANSS